MRFDYFAGSMGSADGIGTSSHWQTACSSLRDEVRRRRGCILQPEERYIIMVKIPGGEDVYHRIDPDSWLEILPHGHELILRFEQY